VACAAVCVAAALAGCGKNKPAAASGPSQPSVSARMICAPEAVDDIAASVRTRTISPVTPRWANGVYSCDYAYPNGTMTLSVTELSSQSAAVALFSRLASLRGRSPEELDLGDRAFVATDGSVIVRKDAKVLVVDVRAAPPTIGLLSKADAAQAAALDVMNCWKGE
jgi:hypothetical protein